MMADPAYNVLQLTNFQFQALARENEALLSLFKPDPSGLCGQDIVSSNATVKYYMAEWGSQSFHMFTPTLDTRQ